MLQYQRLNRSVDELSHTSGLASIAVAFSADTAVSPAPATNLSKKSGVPALRAHSHAGVDFPKTRRSRAPHPRRMDPTATAVRTLATAQPHGRPSIFHRATASRHHRPQRARTMLVRRPTRPRRRLSLTSAAMRAFRRRRRRNRRRRRRCRRRRRRCNRRRRRSGMRTGSGAGGRASCAWTRRPTPCCSSAATAACARVSRARPP